MIDEWLLPYWNYNCKGNKVMKVLIYAVAEGLFQQPSNEKEAENLTTAST